MGEVLKDRDFLGLNMGSFSEFWNCVEDGKILYAKGLC
jgi:hypothetical protein